MKKIFTTILLTITLVGEASPLRLGSIFTDHMVLQQDSQVPVWGQSKPEATVEILCDWTEKNIKVNADKNGSWKALIPTVPASFQSHEMKVISDGDTLKLSDILMGEVWVLGGQSNMSMPLEGYPHQPVEGATDAILSSVDRVIRFANVPNLAAYRPLEYVEGIEWLCATPATTGKCSAVGWFFADRLQSVLKVPVGLINISFSGSNLESWLSKTTCARLGMEVPEESDYTDPWIGNVATVLYNGMMKPVEGYGLRGMLFYQGESNIFDIPAYGPMLEEAVTDWRLQWDRDNWPFYYVQIAPYDYTEWNFFTPQWPEVSSHMRDVQRQYASIIPNSGMVVTLDVGTDYIIHPPFKRPVGDRLAFIALSDTYGIGGFESHSPEFDHMEVIGDKAVIHFKNLHNGLTSYGKPLELFEIAGDNKVFVKGDAIINQDNWTVEVSSKLVSEPKAVRYAMKDYVKAELFGTGGLPVSSFKTDNW